LGYLFLEERIITIAFTMVLIILFGSSLDAYQVSDSINQ